MSCDEGPKFTNAKNVWLGAEEPDFLEPREPTPPSDPIPAPAWEYGKEPAPPKIPVVEFIHRLATNVTKALAQQQKAAARITELEERLEALEQWKTDWQAHWAEPKPQPRPHKIGPKNPIIIAQGAEQAKGKPCHTGGCTNPAVGISPYDERPTCMDCLEVAMRANGDHK